MSWLDVNGNQFLDSLGNPIPKLVDPDGYVCGACDYDTTTQELKENQTTVSATHRQCDGIPSPRNPPKFRTKSLH